MADIPKEILEPLKSHLTAIGRLFKSPRITLIVRGPEIGNATGDLVLTTDNPTLAIKALTARMVAEAEIYAGTAQQMKVIEKERSAAPPFMSRDEIDPFTRPSGNNFKDRRK